MLLNSRICCSYHSHEFSRYPAGRSCTGLRVLERERGGQSSAVSSGLYFAVGFSFEAGPVVGGSVALTDRNGPATI